MNRKDKFENIRGFCADPGPGRLGSLGTISEIGLLTLREADDLGPTAWNCHLHPSFCFSGSSNHLIHAFVAVASLGNLCPPKLLHLGTQHSVPRLFLLRLSMPPTATHQQDNSYGGSAIWRVSKFVIPLIPTRLIIELACSIDIPVHALVPHVFCDLHCGKGSSTSASQVPITPL